MKISGFTFCRNAVKYDYPIVESITSALPLCDEFIVNVGRCGDGTLELIQSIRDPKIKIVESVWDESLRQGGLIYSQQTNIALAHCTGDWAFYIQADEVFHEDDLPVLRRSMEQHAGNPNVKGLLFRYLHFIADYWSTNPWFYHKAVRVKLSRAAMLSDFISRQLSNICKAVRGSGSPIQAPGCSIMDG